MNINKITKAILITSEFFVIYNIIVLINLILLTYKLNYMQILLTNFLPSTTTLFDYLIELILLTVVGVLMLFDIIENRGIRLKIIYLSLVLVILLIMISIWK
jgi:hypothetical protein